MDQRKARMETDKTKYNEKSKDYIEKQECAKKLECEIGSNNFKYSFISNGARKECIGMTNEVDPTLKC